MMNKTDTRIGATLKRLALACAAALCAAAGSAHAQTGKSSGVYRIPFTSGTQVHVTNDHTKHSPPGRIDMSGKGNGSGEYKIVAAADGRIKYIEDGFSKQVESGSGEPCTNNYVWIEHANGEWTKYSHMQKNSSTVKAKLKVGQFVKAGTYLGDEGKVGCAGGDHLHFEVGVPRATDPIDIVGGFLKDNGESKRNRIPRVCGISGGIFKSGEEYESRDVPGNLTPGSAEVARHGLPAEDYQCLFDQAVSADYRLEWVDAYDFNGKVYFNAVFRPEGGVKWTAVHGLTGAQYQDAFDKNKAAGYKLRQVDSYLSGNQARYAAVFVKDAGPAVVAYHGVPADEHQKKFDELTAGPWKPKNISVVSVGGQRFYTALYENLGAGVNSMAKSFMTPAEYQQQFNENKQKGRHLVYLNAYEHQGQPRFTAIWNSSTSGGLKARHDMTGAQYQDEWEAARKTGLLTRAVTGYEDGGSLRFAAFWVK
ncbi:MAG TPA: peptidoglycan DD-metalloendopeptidase family protein [Pyrinomonadaceae bacterium]|nr:peptidoglycan DD-metalloendopeptidase family protein [Pyrinomonadaceae bacterium]